MRSDVLVAGRRAVGALWTTGAIVSASGLAAALFVAGCSGSSNDAASAGSASLTCRVVDAAAACDPTQPVPSFMNDVFPILQRDCNGPCHVQGGIAWPLTGYQDVFDWSFLIQIQVDSCQMPPADAGALPEADRAALLAWIACGSPNN